MASTSVETSQTTTASSPNSITQSSLPDMDCQKAEVAAIKQAFPNRCRIICDVGAYSNVVTVQPQDMDVTIKFQLTPAYPTVVPDIAIRSESLTERTITEMQQNLRSKASEMIGQPMIQTLIKEAEEEFRHAGLRPGKSTNVNAHIYIGKKSPKKKKPKSKPKSEDETIESKLPPMKTSDDVVKRIIWDENLDKDEFIVGYFDRFLGLQEKYFSAFSWEDLASVDYDVLAVPKHRIQYFKYKDVKVWDKPRRIDNVFGSAEGTKTIDVIIREIEEMERLRQQQQASGGPQGVDDKNDDVDDESSYSDDDDDDDDDGIVVTIGASANIGVPSKPNSSGMKENDQCNTEVDGAVQSEYDPYWRDKLRPNYFLCMRITDEGIMEKIGNIQDHLMEKVPVFSECCIPGASLHVTVCTLGLDTGEQLQQCIDALNKMEPDLESALPNTPLKLQGVSHFYNRVIYAQVQRNKEFLQFCDLVKLNLKEAGVQIRDGYDFVPHVTIMKVTRPVSRLRGTKNIEVGLYDRFANMEFGEQKVSSLNLCSMGLERRSDGFYVSPWQAQFRF